MSTGTGVNYFTHFLVRNDAWNPYTWNEPRRVCPYQVFHRQPHHMNILSNSCHKKTCILKDKKRIENPLSYQVRE